ncbi:MAG: hypothetical protein MZU79_02375 [Anaerotruncus sp.]|nr:hypothetical protein [Anaerotruncus sp.]
MIARLRPQQRRATSRRRRSRRPAARLCRDRRHGDHHAPRRCHVVGLFPVGRGGRGGGARGGAGTCPGSPTTRRRFGEQLVSTPTGATVGRETADARRRPSALVARGDGRRSCTRHGGLAVAAHVDRRSFSVLEPARVLPAEAGVRRAGDLGRTARRAWAARPFASCGFPVLPRLRRPRARAGRRRAYVVLDVERAGLRASSPCALAGARRQGVRDCVSSPCTSSTSSRTRCGPGRRVVAVAVEEQTATGTCSRSRSRTTARARRSRPSRRSIPFYTTKEGKRTGLGLSLFRQQVEHGRAAASSSAGRALGGARGAGAASGSVTWTGTRSATWPAPLAGVVGGEPGRRDPGPARARRPGA